MRDRFTGGIPVIGTIQRHYREPPHYRKYRHPDIIYQAKRNLDKRYREIFFISFRPEKMPLCFAAHRPATDEASNFNSAWRMVDTTPSIPDPRPPHPLSPTPYSEPPPWGSQPTTVLTRRIRKPSATPKKITKMWGKYMVSGVWWLGPIPVRKSNNK